MTSSLIHYAITLIYAVAGVVNTLPVIGVISNARIAALYGVDVVSDDLSLLLRHRAVLFGVVGALLLIAAFAKPWRTVAGLAGLLSMLSFAVLSLGLADLNESVRRIVTIDWIVSAFLFAALILHLTSDSASPP